MKRILFSAHDPGGFNLLKPIIRRLLANDEIEVHLLLAGAALASSKEHVFLKCYNHSINSFPCPGFPGEMDVSLVDVQKIIKEVLPHVVITSTSINSNLERYCIFFAKHFGSITASFIDSWLGENIRFSSPEIKVLPDYILVCDEEMARPYLPLMQEGVTVISIGNPFLEELFFNDLNEQTVQSPDPNRVLFFSENLYHYFPNGKVTEPKVLESIMSHYRGRKIKISVRPHPLENREHWDVFLNMFNSSNAYIDFELDDIKDLRTSIKASAISFGISTMALIESSLYGAYTFSYQVGIENDKSLLYIPFSKYGIEQKSTLADVCNCLSNCNASMKKPITFPFQNALKKIDELLFTMFSRSTINPANT